MSNYQQATGKTIDEAFAQFDTENPKVWETFHEQCLRAIRLGRKKISAKQLIGYIRWHVSLTTNTDDGFKINDAFTSRYSRKFAEIYPQYLDIFNYRELRSGEETIKKQLLTEEQILVLKQMTYFGKITKLSNYIQLNFLTDGNAKVSKPIDQFTFNKLLKLSFIEQTETPDLFAEIYSISEKGKKYLQSITKPVAA